MLNTSDEEAVKLLAEFVRLKSAVGSSDKTERPAEKESLQGLRLRTRCVGVVKSYNPGKAWGFITFEGSDVFVHVKDCRDGAPTVGDNVTFDMDMDPVRIGQKKALNVQGCTGNKADSLNALAGMPIGGQVNKSAGSKSAGSGAGGESQAEGINQGEVKMFNEEKGFGFIFWEQSDVFFHKADCKGDKLPVKGDWLTFDLQDDNVRGGQKKAHNIRVISDWDTFDWKPQAGEAPAAEASNTRGSGWDVRAGGGAGVAAGQAPNALIPVDGQNIVPVPGLGYYQEDDYLPIKPPEGDGWDARTLDRVEEVEAAGWGPIWDAPCKGGCDGPYGGKSKGGWDGGKGKGGFTRAVRPAPAAAPVQPGFTFADRSARAAGAPVPLAGLSFTPTIQLRAGVRPPLVSARNPARGDRPPRDDAPAPAPAPAQSGYGW